MGSINDTFQADAFCGDFDTLPVRSHLLFGAVPLFPTSDDFQLAAMVASHANDAAAEWRVEAIRWRRGNEGKPLDLRAIAVATSERLFKLCAADSAR